jgi:uncharacterized protein (TIGR00255 family)
MTLSMTAFDRIDRTTEWGELAWDLRTVNHRYLEKSPRLPEILRALEPKIRTAVRKVLTRGKVDLNVRFQAKAAGSEKIELDTDLVKKLLAAADEVGHMAGGAQPIEVAEVLRWPGVIKEQEFDNAALQKQVMDCLAEALAELVQTRQREGDKLQAMMLERVEAMKKTVSGVNEILPELLENYRKRLTDRLQEIIAEVDQDRVEQELVIYAQKTDVAEELDRLNVHLGEVERVLNQKKPVGRRLDFLMQELNREANTLGSKATDIRLTNAAVDLKVLIEQMREQVQNIE